MLKNIRLEKFKAFNESQVITGKPITFLYGQNSAGKSTIIQSLLLMKQSMKKNNEIASELIPKGDYLNLGNYKEMVYGHNNENKIKIGLNIDFYKSITNFRSNKLFISQNRDYLKFIKEVGSELSFSSDKKGIISMDNINIYINGFSKPTLVLLKEKNKNEINNKRKMIKKYDNNYYKIDQINFDSPIWEDFYKNFLKFTKEMDLYLQNTVKDILKIIKKDLIFSLFEKPLKKIENRNNLLDKMSEHIIDNFNSFGEVIDKMVENDKNINSNIINLIKNIEKYIKNGDSKLELLTEIVDNLKKEETGKKYKIEELDKLLEHKEFIQNINHERFYSKVEEIWKEVEIPLNGININMLNRIVYGSEFEYTINSYFPSLIDFINRISNSISNILDSIIYLGPLREYPERHYIFSGIGIDNVGKTGKHMPELLFLNKNLIPEVNKWLEKFNINYKMTLHRIDNNDIDDIYYMRLNDTATNISVSPLDVGFGISQILPIIVQSLICKNSLILIEQPEIHLHPKLQTEFGSFLAEAIKENNQFIVETHSEHILLRIQKLIRQKQLTKDDVAIMYVDRQTDGSKCIEIRLDEDGNFLDPWPNGFFEEGYEEVFDL